MDIQTHGDSIINQLLESESWDHMDKLAYELVEAIYAGYPTSSIQRLLNSGRELAVLAGLYATWELGSTAENVTPYLAPFLDHTDRRVRFQAVGAVHSSASGEYGQIIAKAIALVADPVRMVRWRVLDFLAKADREQLSASLPYLDIRLRELVSWVMLEGKGSHKEAVPGMLDSHVPLDRLIAAAALVRDAFGGDEADIALVEAIANDGDDEVAEFARDQLTILRA